MQPTIRPQFVDHIPEQLADGVLYICQAHRIAVHRCCCGCGEEVVTPLSPADWAIRLDGSMVTMQPSIGNWGLACHSHYWIRRNKVIWARSMTQSEIARVREQDRKDKAAFIGSANRAKGLPGLSDQTGLNPSLWQRLRGLWRALWQGK